MKTLLYIIIVVAIALGIWFVTQDKSEVPKYNTVTETPQATSTSPTQSTTTPPTTSGLTLSIVATHKNEASCYTVISGKVYDLTDWISKHPGGKQAILSICGKDGTAAFNAQHGGAAKQQEILKAYFIGNLEN